MHIVVSGSGGLIGRHLVSFLRSRGHLVRRLVRSDAAAESPDAVRWDPVAGKMDPAVLAAADAVVNLNGRSLSDRRWTTSFKQDLRSSRLTSTRTLVRAFADADPRPSLLVSASAVGYYGDRGDEPVDESAEPGAGFLADLARDWELEARAAADLGARVVCLRLGIVVGRGGALGAMTPIFKLGLGGPVGSGRQWWSWVAMEDVLGVVRLAVEEPGIQGPVNVVSPQQVRCREFVRTLGSVLRRPAVLPVPAPAARLALGEMADEMLLASTRARPTALEAAGYDFQVPDLEQAMKRALD